jgi:lysophospholipase L1-like esterase
MLNFNRLTFSLFTGLAASIICVSIFIRSAGADIGSNWLSPTSLALQQQGGLSTTPVSINGNIDCIQEQNAVCSIVTGYGQANTSGAVRLSNSSDFLPVYNYIDNHQHFIAVPNSKLAISYTTGPVYGFNLYFNYGFSSSIKKVNDALGLHYQIIKPPDARLTDGSNHLLPADYASISFSENGRWMVVSEPNVAMLRVDLETFEAIPFAPGFNYTLGLNPAPQTAITNDGRYAAVSSKDFNRFNVYDLNTCGAVPITISGPVSCQSRDLGSFMQQKISGYTSTTNLRFITEDAMGIYVNYSEGTQHQTSKYILSTGDGAIHQQDYLALGDSYISGEGAFEYLDGTDTSNNQCHVSALSYPYLLGLELNYNSYHSAACSGATTNDITDSSEDYKGQTNLHESRKGLDSDSQIPSILSSFQPGYIDQLDFVSQYQPKIITLSVGGNDIGFSAKLQSCLELGTCYSTYEDRLEFVREVNGKFDSLVNTYAKIKNADAPDALIYVIGYPQIALPGGNCALNVHMNNDELNFTEQAISYLDAVISQAAAKAGVFYVDTQDALFGHRLCEAGPGSAAMNGLTAGNDFPDRFNGPIGRESYHPNAFGYQLLEDKILAATHNLSSPMPAVDPNAAPPAETGLDILSAPRSSRAIKVTEYEPNLINDAIYKEVPSDINIDGASHSLAPSSTLQAEIHSIPTILGTYTTDSTGSLNAQLTIPASLPAGYHSLHFFGNDIAGQTIDIYKIIYVAGTADDIDGNGIADDAQKCVGLDPSGQDFDQDGIDDSCDADIAQPPIQIITPSAVSASMSPQDNRSIPSTSSDPEQSSLTNTTNVVPPESTSNKGIVLAAHTTSNPSQPNSAQSKMRFSNAYFAAAGLAIFIASSIIYFGQHRLK